MSGGNIFCEGRDLLHYTALTAICTWDKKGKWKMRKCAQLINEQNFSDEIALLSVKCNRDDQ